MIRVPDFGVHEVGDSGELQSVGTGLALSHNAMPSPFLVPIGQSLL